MKLPTQAFGVIALMGTASLAVIAMAVSQSHGAYGYPFWALLLLALATARMKVTLPGLTGNMAVSLPFLLIATTQLTLWEALLVALPSCAAQSFPKQGGRPKAVHVVFNLSTMAVAVAAASLIGSHLTGWGSAGFFAVQTAGVAAIIRATEGGLVRDIWLRIAACSFPFYVLSAGVCMIVTASAPQIGWQVPLLTIPVLYATYRCYETYLRAIPAAVPVRGQL